MTENCARLLLGVARWLWELLTGSFFAGVFFVGVFFDGVFFAFLAEGGDLSGTKSSSCVVKGA